MKRKSSILVSLSIVFMLLTINTGLTLAGDCGERWGGPAGSQDKLVQDIRACVQEARIRDATFTAWPDPQRCAITTKAATASGQYAAEVEFDGCMHQAGFAYVNQERGPGPSGQAFPR